MAWLHGEKQKHELDAEIAAHLAMAAADKRERGASDEAARQQAQREFGNIALVKDVTHASWGWVWLERLLQDVRYALRQLRRSPGFAAMAILTLALGIGATTLVFSLVYGAVIDPYPYKDADRIVQMGFLDKQGIRGFMSVNLHDLETVLHASSVENAMLTSFDNPITTIAGYSEDVEVAQLSGQGFQFLGVAPLFGRTLTDEDEEKRVVVLGYAFCREHFVCDPSVLGKNVDLNRKQYTVAGVMPPRFTWEQAAVFTLFKQGASPDDGGTLYLRRRQNVSSEVLAAQMLSLVRQFVLASDGVNLPPEVRLHPVPWTQRRGSALPKQLEMLFVAVFSLLLIACGNISILLLGRATVRRHEFEIRKALGASRARVLRQLLTESILLAFCGTALGVLFTWGGIALMRTSLVKAFFPSEAILTVNPWVLAFSVMLAIGSGILFGLVPGMEVSSIFKAHGLRSAFTLGSMRSRRSHQTLMTAQVALTLLLLVTAGIAIRAFINLSRLDLGYDPHNVLTFRLASPQGEYNSWSARMQYTEALQQRLQTIPGVLAASVGEAMPTGGGFQMEYALPQDIYGADMDVKMPRVDMEFVDASYFSAIRIPVIAGRSFSQEEYERGEAVALVSSAFAHYVFGKEDPIGHELRIPPLVAGYPGTMRPDHPHGVVRIIGVTGNATAAWSGGAPPRQSLYLPGSLFAGDTGLRVHLRTAGDPMAVLPTVRRVISQIDSRQPLSQVRTLDEILAQDLQSRNRWLAILFGAFSGTALLLAAVGLYSIASFVVAQRNREFGVRIALGAGREDIRQLVLFSQFAPVLTGILFGTMLSIFLEKILRATMNAQWKDVWFLPVGSLLLLTVTALASWQPARRASRVDPAQALRAE
jgi:predicted permease